MCTNVQGCDNGGGGEPSGDSWGSGGTHAFRKATQDTVICLFICLFVMPGGGNHEFTIFTDFSFCTCQKYFVIQINV